MAIIGLEDSIRGVLRVRYIGSKDNKPPETDPLSLQGIHI